MSAPELNCTIIMPALNEERYIAEAISSVLPAQEDGTFEVLVLDGGSIDRTRDIVNALSRSDPRIRLVPNPRRTQAAAVNIAASLAHPHSSIIVRADCHARYPKGFVVRAARRLLTTGAASVVVPMRTVSEGGVQHAIAAAQNSPLGNGGAKHRTGTYSGFVDHGHHAAFDRDAFTAIGGYDESFLVNEDAEFDHRLIASGRRIYLDADLSIDYVPRATFQGLARQYYRFGKGRIQTLIKHRMWPKPRQVLPVLATLALACAPLLAAAYPAFLAVPMAYLGLALGWGALLAARHGQPWELLSGAAALVMHLSWGAGFLVGLASSSAARARGGEA